MPKTWQRQRETKARVCVGPCETWWGPSRGLVAVCASMRTEIEVPDEGARFRVGRWNKSEVACRGHLFEERLAFFFGRRRRHRGLLLAHASAAAVVLVLAVHVLVGRRWR